MKTTRTRNLILVPLFAGLAITTASALGQSTDGLDRTVLPITEPQYPPITELDTRNAKAPPRFEIKAPAAAPNVVIVLLDDIGFGQSGAFGGPCNMPALDRLAANGLRYNAFHTTALCSPTRTALLTGRNHHVNNAGAIMELATAFPGNTGIRPNSVAPLAEMLRQNGYSTAAFGKYHETPPWEVSVSGPYDQWPTHSGLDKFNEGWDKLREEIFAKQKEMGIIPQSAQLTTRPKEIPAWDSMNADQKRLLARQMEVFAGFAEQTDYEVGRLVQSLSDMGDLDNTFFIYIVGDNGSSAEGGPEGTYNEMMALNGIVGNASQMMNHIDDWGSPNTFPHYAIGWAHALDTPLQWTKQIASHWGGTRNGMVMHWPERIKAKGGIRSQFSHVVDIAPTV